MRTVPHRRSGPSALARALLCAGGVRSNRSAISPPVIILTLRLPICFFFSNQSFISLAIWSFGAFRRRLEGQSVRAQPLWVLFHAGNVADGCTLGRLLGVILLTPCGASTESQESYINYNLQGLGGEQSLLEPWQRAEPGDNTEAQQVHECLTDR